MPQSWGTTGLFSSLFPTKNQGQQTGDPSTFHGVISAPVPSWAHLVGAGGEPVPDAGAHARDAPSASRQAAGSAAAARAQQQDAAVIDGMFIMFRLCSGC